MAWRMWLLLSVLLGVLGGLGAFTFNYAEGLSYFSNDPQACANCHIMDDYLASWTHSSHSRVATCNDCHTPHDFFGKYMTKAENGWFHSYSFTMQTFPENLVIRDSNRRKLEANCVECHKELVSEINAVHALPGTAQALGPGGSRVGAHGAAIDCLRCHAGVGHGPRK